MSARRRLTVSLLLPGRVATEIDGIRRGLGAAALERIAPHLTLVPPVNVAEEELGAVLETLRRAASKVGPLRLELGPPESFLPATPVVYLAVGGDLTELEELRDLLTTGPLRPPPRREERPFVPHVTLDQKIAPERAPAALEALSSYRATVTVEQVTLLQFDESERRWVPLASAGLGEERVVGRGGVEIELTRSSGLDPEGRRFQEEEWEAYSLAAYGVNNPDVAYAVTAREAGAVVGTATGQLRPDFCRLGNLVVAGHARRRGIGAKLVRAVEELAAEKGSERVRLETRAGGPAEDFYRRLGYEAIAIIPAFREGRDFLLMEKVIAPRRG